MSTTNKNPIMAAVKDHKCAPGADETTPPTLSIGVPESVRPDVEEEAPEWLETPPVEVELEKAPVETELTILPTPVEVDEAIEKEPAFAVDDVEVASASLLEAMPEPGTTLPVLSDGGGDATEPVDTAPPELPGGGGGGGAPALSEYGSECRNVAAGSI